MTIDKALTLDLNRVQPHKVIKIHEGDVNSVFLVLTVTKDGAAVSLSGLTIKYDATIAGYLAEQDASGSVSSGKIRIPITKNMTALPGTLKIDIKMKSGTEVLYTQTVTMIVDKSVVDDSTIIDFDGTTIGGRLTALEGGFLDVKTLVRQLNAKFPIEADDIADNQVIKVKSISNDDATVNAAVENNTAYRVTLEGRSNLMFCVNSGTNLRAQVRFDTLGYMKYRSQTKHDDVWDDWTAWSPIASGINIATSAVSTAKLADYAVTTAKIASGAVTEEKLASNAVTAAKIATGAIHSQHLSAGAVDTDAIETGAVTTNEIANGAVTNAKIAYNSVSDDRLMSGSVTADKIGVGAITTVKLASKAVTGAKIADGAVGSDQIANDAVTTAKIADGAVTSAKLDDSVLSGVMRLAPLVNSEAAISGYAPGQLIRFHGNIPLLKTGATGSDEFIRLVDADDIPDDVMALAPEANSSEAIAALPTGQLFRCQGEVAVKSADSYIQLAKTSSVPTKTSDLQNDSGFITQHQDISGLMLYAPVVNTAQQVSALHGGQLFLYQSEVCVKTNDDYIHLAKLSQIPSKTSDLTNDSGFLTQHQDISGKADKATTLAGYGITNAYSKSEIDGVFMELAPDTNPGSIGTLEDGQLFRCQGSVALKTGNASDYIELAKKSTVPTKTSDLQNDSGFVSDLSDYMRLAHTTSSEDSGQFYLDRVGLSQNAVNLYLALYNDESKRVAWFEDIPTKTSDLTNDSGFLTQHQDISGKADIESGTVPSNHAWYTDEGQGYTMTGNYTIIGNMCFLRATAYLINGWARVYYSLPVASTASSATVALQNDDTYSIATGTQNNVSVLEIKKIGSSSMGSGTISFTLIYKCR